jgi:ERF superfamily protein
VISESVPVHVALARVMSDVLAVRKLDRNTQQGFQFRGIDAVLNAVGPAFRTHGIVVMPHLITTTAETVEVGAKRTPMLSRTVIVRYEFIGPQGDTRDCQVPGEAMDAGDKGTAKAMSVAYRTALLQVLCLPTDEPDPDHDTYERAPATEGSTRAELVGRLDAVAAKHGITRDKVTARWLESNGWSSLDRASLPDLLKFVLEAEARPVRGQS